MSDLFLLNAGLFPFSLSEISEISKILVSPTICTKIRTWRFHRTEQVSNNFSVSRHITHISMAISANLGRDTNHNSTKLVCAPPLSLPLTIVDNSTNLHNTGFFQNCFLLSVTYGCIWIPYLARYLEIFKKPNFSGSKMQAHVHLKNALPGGIGNRWIMVCLQSLVCLPHPSIVSTLGHLVGFFFWWNFYPSQFWTLPTDSRTELQVYQPHDVFIT